MDIENEFIYTGVNEKGMKVFCKIDTVGGERFLKVKYKDYEDNEIGVSQLYTVNHIKFLNAIIDGIDMTNGIEEE